MQIAAAATDVNTLPSVIRFRSQHTCSSSSISCRVPVSSSPFLSSSLLPHLTSPIFFSPSLPSASDLTAIKPVRLEWMLQV